MFWVVCCFSQYWKQTLGFIGCFAELGQWSLPWWVTGEESDCPMLPARHSWLGLSNVWLYPLVCVFASLHANRFTEASHPNAECVSGELLGAGEHYLPAVTCWHPLTPFGSPLGCCWVLAITSREISHIFFNSVGLYVFSDWAQMFHGIRQCFHQLKTSF